MKTTSKFIEVSLSIIERYRFVVAQFKNESFPHNFGIHWRNKFGSAEYNRAFKRKIFQRVIAAALDVNRRFQIPKTINFIFRAAPDSHVGVVIIDK